MNDTSGERVAYHAMESYENPGVLERDRELSLAVQDGIIAQASLTNDFDSMLPIERITAAEQVVAGQKARSQMFEMYQPTIETVIDGMVEGGKLPESAVDEDMHSAASLALFESIPLWDADSKQYFNGFINIAIKRAIFDEYGSRSVAAAVGRVHHEVRAEIEATRESDLHITTEELAEALGVEPDTKVKDMNHNQHYGQRFKRPEDYVAFLEALTDYDEVAETHPEVKRESYYGSDGKAVHKEVPLVEEVVIKQFLKLLIDEALEELSGREATVLRMRFGLDTGVPMTLEQVARLTYTDEITTTRERIRQIESKALAHLRNPERRTRLESWLNS